MSEIQKIVRSEPGTTPVDTRLSAGQRKARVQRKKLADATARVVITAGGIGVVLSIVAIFVVIVAETLPLWQSATAEELGPPIVLNNIHGIDGERAELTESVKARVTLPEATVVTDRNQAVRSLVVGVNEHRSLVYIVTAAGTIDFLSLPEGRLVQRYHVKGLDGQQPTAVYHESMRQRVALGTSTGAVIPLTIHFPVTFEEGERVVTPHVDEGDALQVDPQGRAVTVLAYQEEEGEVAAAVLLGPRTLIFYGTRQQSSLFDSASTTEEYRSDLSAALQADVTALAVDTFRANLLVGTDTGDIYHWHIAEPQNPQFYRTFAAGESGAGISTFGWVLGGRSLVVGDAAGTVSVWFQVRDRENPEQLPFRKIHVLQSHDHPVISVAPSPRDKSFVTADAAGTILLHHPTSEQTLLRLTMDGNPLTAVSVAPKANGIVAVDTNGQLLRWNLTNAHPEITVRTLFGEVWYEGYEEPDYTWQSSSGSDDFEPKFSLTPLAYGTLKGTFYALLLAVPLSICGAIYTSQFMHPALRNVVKPTVEVMAALPSVVLGFFAGLWLAPLVEEIVPAVMLMLIVVPLVTLAAAFFWRLIPLPTRSRWKPGVELLLLCPVLLVALYGCICANEWLEATLFAGDFRQWLFDTTGLRYDPRNSIVVGFAMGFAIIPIIYTICEDAFSNVPQHLVSGSLALGANRWQTALRVVLPTASPGVFSAIMIGFGRAVGETMIVLMATGNTPVMDFSPFSGFRALSANIAVEIPEAPYGSTLYRVLFLAALLLFILTFLVNTAAELVRQSLRVRYSRI